MRDVGLIWMKDLAQKLPQLQALDVSHNKIYSLKNLDEMNALESLVEVNIQKNPIDVHKDLKDMLKEAVPAIEVINNTEIRETGAGIKNEINRMKKQINELGAEGGNIDFDAVSKDKDVGESYLKSLKDKAGQSEDQKLNNAMARMEVQHRMGDGYHSSLKGKMFDAERNMGFKMKFLGKDDITNGESEYSTGLITGKQAEYEADDNDDELLHDATLFKQNSK